MSAVLDEALSDPLYTGSLELLEPPGQQRKSWTEPASAPPFADLPIVSIGRPRAWPIDKLFGSQKIPREVKTSLEHESFFVLRLACSFRPQRDEVSIAWAQLVVQLKPDEQGVAPLAFDLYPMSVEREQKVGKTLSLAPSLKFNAVELGLGSFSYSVEYPAMEPLITAAGLHESIPTWNFTAVPGFPLTGAKLLHAVVAAPRALNRLSVAVALRADLDYGRRRFGAWLRNDPARVQPATTEVQLWP